MTNYEWDVEENNDDGDIVDHNHFETYQEACEFYNDILMSKSADQSFSIVLVKDTDSYRAWAYMVDDKLPTYFTDAQCCDAGKVPQRFHQEVSK